MRELYVARTYFLLFYLVILFFIFWTPEAYALKKVAKDWDWWGKMWKNILGTSESLFPPLFWSLPLWEWIDRNHSKV